MGVECREKQILRYAQDDTCFTQRCVRGQSGGRVGGKIVRALIVPTSQRRDMGHPFSVVYQGGMRCYGILPKDALGLSAWPLRMTHLYLELMT